MSICLPNLTLSFLTICKIITFKVEVKVFFAPTKGDSNLLGSKKTTFSSTFRMCLFRFLFLGELGTCPQNLMPMRKSSNSTRGYAEIHIQRPFFDNKNSIWKILGLKIQTMKTCSSASSIHRNFYFWNILRSRFLVEFQSFVFGQIWAVLGNFGQILLHWQWLTACPNLGWNLKNLITFEP
jgi:hypothetical protein